MKKKISLITVLILIFNVICPILSIAADDSNTIYIGAEEELWEFAESVNSGEDYSGKTIKLTNDIILNCNEEKSWIPIGNYDTPFKGTFCGEGKTISGMEIYQENKYTGFFGYIYKGTIENFTLSNSMIQLDIDETAKYIGMLVGIIGTGNIRNCKTEECEIIIATGNIATNVGGITGIAAGGKYNDGITGISGDSNIINTSSNTTIQIDNTNKTYVKLGGIAGYASNSNLKACSNMGQIEINEFNDATGGIVGENYATIINCYNAAKISTVGVTNYNCVGTGGIAGANHATVIESYNIAEISGTRYVGGITGTNFDTGDNVEECYNRGNITGECYIGGITGRNGSTSNVSCYGATIENCYNVGEISYTDTNAGNIVGYNKVQGVIENCYYATSNVEGYGSNNSQDTVEIYEKESTKMKESSFIEELNGDTTSYTQDSYTNNNGYPILVWITDIEIVEKPTKLVYKQNKEELDLSGGKVKLLYNYEEYNTTIDMADDSISVDGFDNSEEKELTLTVTYENEFEKYFDISIVESIPPVLSIEYSTTKATNQDVIAIITANEKIQEAEGWSLSSDEMKLTKTYSTNHEESVEVFDIVGNAACIEVEINNIDKQAPELNATYSIEEITNQDVVVTITANEKVQEVEGWSLSDNKKELTKTYTINGQEIVDIYDIAGNKSNITISVQNIEKSEIELETEYSTTKKTNQNVEIEVTANKEIQEVEGWTLSEDKTKLSKTYYKNGTEKLTVYDMAGNSKTIIIKVNNIDKQAPKAIVSYSNKEITNQNVEVSIVANEQIQEVEGWILSEDETTLTKIYSENEEEIIKVYDLAGNTTSKKVEINNIVTGTIEDDTVVETELPQAGEKTLIFIYIVIALMIVILLWIRIKEFKDIK